MNHDIDVKKVRVNCYRQSKVAGEFMLQLRVPGALIPAKYLTLVQELCETYGNGTFHMGTRQMLCIPGIKYENIEACNARIKEYINDIDVELCGVDMNTIAHQPAEYDPMSGYPTIGARNIVACIGNAHCIKGNINTYEMARKIEKLIFPSHYHTKIVVTPVSN